MKLIKQLLCSVSTFLVLSTQSIAQPLVQLDQDQVASVKAAIADKSAPQATLQTYHELLTRADTLLDQPNPTVMNKNFFPPSKDKHDYLSISRYWWPDESQPEGLPWVRKDGQTNPSTQTDDVDRQRLGRMAEAVSTLGLAYYYSGNESYAKKSASMINTWFLDDATRMNPHLQYAQSVPGNPQGRRSGILDGRLIPLQVLDGLVLISDSEYWSNNDNDQMNAWLTDYLEWLTKSDLGIQGAQQTNNHGSWYKFQIAALSWYLGNEEQTEAAIDATKDSLSYQFAADGSQPEELERTRSFFYSTFNLEALTSIAIIADKAGIPIWTYQTPKGNSLKSAIDYLLPVAQGEPWDYPTPGIDLAYLAPLLGRIATQAESPQYAKALKSILKDLAAKPDKKDYQKIIYNNFALLYPRYMQ